MTRVRFGIPMPPTSTALGAEHQRVARSAASRHQVAAVMAVVVGAAVVIGVLCGAAVALLSTWWLGLGSAALVTALIWFGGIARRLGTAENRVLELVGPLRPADPLTEARLLNLVDGLAPFAGVLRPRCLVVDDAARNLLALGRDPRHGCMVVTSGLLEAVTRMELEALVAYGLVTLRDGLAAAPTIAIAMGGERLARLAGRPERAGQPDLAAVGLTRYPPGLAAALRKVLAGGPPMASAGSSTAVARFWLAPPGDAIGLSARAQVLEEL